MGHTEAVGAPEDFARVLARFARGTDLRGLPAAVVEAAKDNVFDTLACAAAGSSAAGIGELRSLATEWGGAPQAELLVFGDRVPAHHAAWVNGAMAHARDYDDTHDAAVLHAGVSVVPAALAAAQLTGRATGADFLAGVVAGLETVCRLGVATRVGIIESGYMYTSLFGYFGATIAAARVMGLDEAGIVNALGIAYSQAAGNHQVTRDAALTKRMQPGFAAKAAVVSVQMAQRGIRGVQQTFEGVDGFLRVYLHDRCDRQALREGLGTRYEISGLSYKPYPCCRFAHAAIDAALALRRAHGISADQIRGVRVGMNNQCYEAVCVPVEMRKAPATIVQAQFSIPYCVAAAFVDGVAQLGHFTDASLQRPDLRALAKRVDAYVDERIEREAGRNVSPIAMQVTLADGRTLAEEIRLPLGHPSRPMNRADFDAKARDCFRASARPFPDGAVPALRNAVERLAGQPDLRELAASLRAS